MNKRGFFVLIYLILFLPLGASSAPLCEYIFAPPGAFKTWDPGLNDTVKVNASDFLPASYIAELSQAGKTVTARVLPVMENQNGVTLNFSTSDGLLIGHLSIWPGSSRHSAVIENLRLENPLANSEYKTLGHAQEKKGMPAPVFNHLRDRLFDFLKAGGFKEIEVLTSQNISTYFLYNRMIGAEPVSDNGRKMNTYVMNLMRMRKEIWGEQAHTLDDVTRIMESNYQRGIDGNQFDKLQPHGYTQIQNRQGEIIAIRAPEKANFTDPAKRTTLVVPFLEGMPALRSWLQIHKTCPDCMYMVRKLEP
ncbi:hypothetical protein [Bdellovibrio sp. HCB288]|uniref:hypothetical protein n=1 Tax=Bdellovibrio sp. HCB288 TaxID=3394355 RepID=UPI0039B48526